MPIFHILWISDIRFMFLRRCVITASSLSLVLSASIGADAGRLIPPKKAESSYTQPFQHNALTLILLARNRMSTRHNIQWIYLVSLGLLTSSTIWSAEQTSEKLGPHIDPADFFLHWTFRAPILLKLYAHWNWQSKSTLSLAGPAIYLGLIVFMYSLTPFYAHTALVRTISGNVVNFFFNHPTLSIVIDEAILMMVGLALWQKLDTKRWPRTTVTIPEELTYELKRFALSRATNLLAFASLLYGAVSLQENILYFLPVWALFTFFLNQIDQSLFVRAIGKTKSNDGTGAAATFSPIRRGTMTVWEKEVSFLRFGGLLFPISEYVIPLKWKPLHKRLKDKLKPFFRKQTLEPTSQPASLFIWSYA